MHIALISKNKEKFVDGTLPKPSVSDPLYAPWCSRSIMQQVFGKICESLLSKRYLPHFRYPRRSLQIPAREQDYVIRFLKGLNEKFSHSKSQIMMINPLPDIDRAFFLVIQQERELNSSVTSLVSSTDSSDLAMAMQVSSQQGNHNGKNGYKGKGQGSNSAKGNKYCTHCGRTNHIVENCFVKHGYPPGYRGKGKYQQNSGSQANTTVNEASGSTTSAFGFTQEQYNNIMEFLQQSKANSQPKANSVTTSPFVLNSHSSNASVPIPVSLPNGSQIFVSISGSIVISPSLTLHNNHSKEMIGMANLQRGLYVLDSAILPSTCNSVGNNSLDLWHLRLGHISDVEKLPFPNSITSSCAPFDILHVDLWGPYSTVSLLGHKYFLTLVDDYSRFTWAHRSKFDSRARKAIFLGYKEGTKGYILYDLNSHDFFVSRNVVFYETFFPFKTSSSHSQIPTTPTIFSQTLPDDPIHESNVYFPTQPSNLASPLSLHNSDHFNSSTVHPVNTEDNPLSPSLPTSPNAPPSPTSPITTPNISPSPALSATPTSPITTTPISPSPALSATPITSPVNNNKVAPISLPTRHSTRPSHPPSYLADYHCYSATSDSLELSNNVAHPLSSVLSYSHCSPQYKHYCCSISSNTEPKTFNQANKFECWRHAMNVELQALGQNHTWTVVDLPPGKIPIGCKWIKYHADGSIERYKARLVAKGYTQVEGIDYFDTFSPVAKITTVRVILALAAIKGWKMEQLDVNNAFLHGDLHEEVYMSLPPGHPASNSSKVCKLHKLLYGLKLSSALISLGYSQSQADHSLYIKSTSTSFTALLVYVDDIVLAGNSTQEIHSVKKFLDEQFKIKDLGQLRFFLGLEIARSDSGIFLNQRKYTLELLEDTGFLAAKPSSVPFDPTTKLTISDGQPLEDPSSYRRLIGRLIYLTNTRPDISFAVQHLSQFVSHPLLPHYQAATRVLRYLKSFPAKGIMFSASSSLKLHGFADSDWARCPDTRKSVTGYCAILGSSLICWKSKKQNTVFRSSTEAEYRALASLTCELQ
ncbi:hypothetical protein TSUD_358440 [Trifolium subterraneum]|uniref:Uncharacterized protein n=1 Tax=Trifolium subterraneum TaxID=3900 RepID=A0A2Z6NSK0_TRISU|nr:hypothetical protein TSUD_358440 [Trifolium subterraneum]